jgi:DNA invertase Pin-like site-specific DNA recombinase
MSQNNKKTLDNLLSKILNDADDSDYEDDLITAFNINSVVAPPQPTLSQDDCFEVETLLNDRNNGTRKEYLVRWVDTRYPDEWVDQDNINSSLIQRYELQKQVQQHNLTVQNNRLTQGIFSVPGKAYVELRCSDKENTTTAFKNCSQQNNVVSDTSSNVSFGSGMQTCSFQNYCSSFPTANYSLDYQKNTCFNYCLQNNLEIAMVEMDDGISAKNPDKLPGLQALLENIQPGDYLIFTDFSRFSRNATKGIKILDALHERGIFVRSILDEISYDTPASRHNARQALSNAQFHSELTSQKIKESHKNIRAKGGYIGGIAPYGYKIYKENNIRKLKEKTSEQVVIKFVKACIDNDTFTRGDYKKIANTLNLNKLRYRGKSFTSHTIQQIVKKLRPHDTRNQQTKNLQTQPVSYVANQINREMNAINLNQQRKEKRQLQHNMNRGITTPKNTNTHKQPNLGLSIQPQSQISHLNTYNLRPRNI